MTLLWLDWIVIILTFTWLIWWVFIEEIEDEEDTF